MVEWAAAERGDVAVLPLRLSVRNFLCYRENVPNRDFIINYGIKYRMRRDGAEEGDGG